MIKQKSKLTILLSDKFLIFKNWIFELLLFLDSNNIKESQRRLKSEMDKIKRK